MQRWLKIIEANLILIYSAHKYLKSGIGDAFCQRDCFEYQENIYRDIQIILKQHTQ